VIQGVINLRGRIVPIFNMHRRLHLAEPAASNLAGLTIMIVESSGNNAGLLVDQVTDVVKVDLDRLDRTAAGISGQASCQYVDGILEVAGRLVTILKLEPLLASEVERSRRSASRVRQEVRMDEHVTHLSDLQIDTIREISNIGMGTAATALSQMVNQAVSITVPRAFVIDASQVAELMGGEDTPVAASYVQVIGQARGHLVLVFPTSDAHRLIELIAPDASLDLMQDEMARSAVQEIGNILSSNFLAQPSRNDAPETAAHGAAVAVDYAGSILTYVVASMYEITEKLVIVQTEFGIGGQTVRGLCIFVPEPGSLQIILQALGVGGSQWRCCVSGWPNSRSAGRATCCRPWAGQLHRSGAVRQGHALRRDGSRYAAGSADQPQRRSPARQVCRHGRADAAG